MRVEIIKEKKIICSNPLNPLESFFGWPTVCRLPDGTLALASSGLRLGHFCPFGKGVICYSRDEGKSWTAPAVVLDTPLDDRDAGLAVGKDGSVVLTSFNNTVGAQRWANKALNKSEKIQQFLVEYLRYLQSTDAEEKYLGSLWLISRDGGYHFDEMKKVPVSAPHGPAPLQEGGFLYVGTLFDSDDKDGVSKRGNSVVCIKVDEKGDWEYLSEIDNVDEEGCSGSYEPHAIQLPDGKIVVHIRVQFNNHKELTVYQSESVDGGVTFTKPHKLTDRSDIRGPAHLMYHSSGALISTYGCRNKPFGVGAIISYDGGETWSEELRLVSDGHSKDIGYPCSVELENGDILTVYYDHQDALYDNDSPAVIEQVVWRITE